MTAAMDSGRRRVSIRGMDRGPMGASPWSRAARALAMVAAISAAGPSGAEAAPAAGVETPSRIDAASPGQKIAITLPDRPPVTLYYEEHGSGPPLVLLHGLGESTFTWHDVAPALAEHHRVIALDLKGFGKSDKPDDTAYTADDQAALVAGFVAARDLVNVTLVGHSFGGTVALRTALANGMQGTGRIARIAVIGAPAIPRSTARYLDLVKTPVIPDSIAAGLAPETLARLLLSEAMGGNAKVDDDDVEGYAAPYRDAAALRAFFATARAIVAEKDASAIMRSYKSIDMPVLVVWCRKDPIVPLKSGRKLAAAVPRAKLAIVEGCHHLPQHERPAELTRLLQTFVHAAPVP